MSKNKKENNTLAGVPKGDLVALRVRHSEFEDTARALFDQAEVFEDDALALKAYQLLVELHRRGLPMPEHMEFPYLTLELKSDARTVVASIGVYPNHWDVSLTVANAGAQAVFDRHDSSYWHTSADALIRGIARQFRGEDDEIEILPEAKELRPN